MKRKLIVLLALICLLTLPSCRPRTPDNTSSQDASTLTPEEMEERYELKVVRVLMDLPNDNAGFGGSEGQLIEALAGLPGYGSEFMLYMEPVPKKAPDRENMMTHIKTEIMAGKGPDLFICHQDNYGTSGMICAGMEESFFQFPEKAMKNRMFLPLDGYIEKAEYMEWDRFLPVVMEAGRNEEGQQMIPLTYSFPVTIAEKEKFGLENIERPKTRMEMTESDNIILRFASQQRLPDYIGRVMEPGADEPMFTEEELLEYVQADREMWEMAYRSDLDALYEDETLSYGHMFRTKTVWGDVPIQMGLDSPEYSIIPVRNRYDGVTANVTAFAAVNRNAKYPDIAFSIIDYMLKTRNQQKSSLFQERLMGGMPVHMDVGTKELPMDDGWYMNEANFKEYEAARSEITEVRFLGPVDREVWLIDSYDPNIIKKSVHEHYVLIQMLLAES